MVSVFAFGVSALGVKMEGVLYDLTGAVFWLFVVLGAIAGVGVAAAWLLPSERRVPAAVAAE